MKVAITGAGIAGLCTAIALKQKGIDAHIFEASPQIKPVGAGISLSANAIKAFDVLGIKDAITSKGNFLESFVLYDEKGKAIVKTNSLQLSAEFGDDNFAIHRADLHKALLQHVDESKISLNKRVVEVKNNEYGVELLFEDGSSFKADCLVAADGIHSPIRKQFVPVSKPRYAGYTCWRGVINNTNMKLNEAAETWGVKGRFGIVPLPGNKIYWFACINSKQNNELMKNYTINDLRNHFKDYHRIVKDVLNSSETKDMIWNDIIDHKPINQYAYGNVLLIGDAAHATTPNMGQGACQAIEDAVVIADELARDNNIQQAFKRFEKRRIPRTHFVVNNSKMIGDAAQIDNRFMAAIRNTIMRILPASVNKKQFRKLYEVDF